MITSTRSRPVFARFYAALNQRMDDEGLGALRFELLAPLSGSVGEIGAGNGRDASRYPTSVTTVTAIEPEPYLRALAGRAAAASTVPVSVVAATAEALPLPPDSCDAAVLCLVLCSLPDRAAALGEIARVLRPGGVLRFLEHTRADSARLRAVQRPADATVWPALTGGCHTATDPVGLIQRSRFEVTALRRLRSPEGRSLSRPAPTCWAPPACPADGTHV